MKGKQKRIDSFFLRKVLPRTTPEEETHESSLTTVAKEIPNTPDLNCDDPSSESVLDRDPGLRKPIWTYPPEKRDEIRRAYWKAGPRQVRLAKFPKTEQGCGRRSFQQKWYSDYLWLEYSEAKDAAYCLPCYLFAERPSNQYGWGAFTNLGFKNWKKVRGVRCSLQQHIGKSHNSRHNQALRMCDSLLFDESS